MKIFWSWQSDTPGNIGKFLVRDALNDAVEKLKEITNWKHRLSGRSLRPLVKTRAFGMTPRD
jgi:hypothetical protein